MNEIENYALNKPLLRFGLVADVQYADSDDKQAWYNPNKTRFYRNSLKQVEKAFQYWETFESESECSVSFILQLGDIIDALNISTCSQSAINRTLGCFLNNPKMPTFHTVGNHELYNFKRSELSQLFDKFLFKQFTGDHSFNIKSSNDFIESFPLYYTFNPLNGIKFISLDTYDISVLGYDSEHSKFKIAAQILEKYHGNYDFELWDTDKNLKGAEKRFQSSNGALSEEQLDWLNMELTNSDTKNEMVFVFGHVGLHPNSCGWDSLLWNYDKVMDCFNRHSCVVAYFSGHAHNSGYAIDNGIHYIVLHGIIETSPENDAFATVTLFEDHIDIDGKGVEQKLTINLNHKFAIEANEDKFEIISEPICDQIMNEELHLVEIEV